jgi:hypothetical protein
MYAMNSEEIKNTILEEVNADAKKVTSIIKMSELPK